MNYNTIYTLSTEKLINLTIFIKKAKSVFFQRLKTCSVWSSTAATPTLESNLISSKKKKNLQPQISHKWKLVFPWFPFEVTNEYLKLLHCRFLINFLRAVTGRKEPWQSAKAQALYSGPPSGWGLKWLQLLPWKLNWLHWMCWQNYAV